MNRIGLTATLVIAIGGIACGGVESDEAIGTPEQALSAGSGVLSSQHEALFWSGTVGPEDSPVGGEPPECSAVPCDHFQLTVDLPPGTIKKFNRPGGGVQVAARWDNEFDTVHVWVYKDGELRAASPGIIAISQSALLPEPENGVYDVWIAYEPEYNVSESVSYEALAQVEFEPAIYPKRRLLPDLTFRSTERINFDTPSFPIFEPDPPPGSTCFVSEMEEDGAQNCLRFDQIIANEGEGNLELTFTVPTGSDEHHFPVSQRIYSSDGGHMDRPAGEMELHGIHGHYHYSSFADARLFPSDAEGRRLSEQPLTSGRKVSFCIADIRIDIWGEQGDGPRTYMAPDCLEPAFSDAVGDHFVQGLTRGWEDIYDWYVPDQYIEVTGVPDGFYRLEFCADPDNEIEEANEDNNCLINHIRLTGVGTADQQVELLGVVDDSAHEGCSRGWHHRRGRRHHGESWRR